MKSKDTKTARSKVTSPVVVPFCKNASAPNGPTAEATARWMSECRVVGRDTYRRKEDASDKRVSDLTSRLISMPNAATRERSIILRERV
jgi:hypothetical protein